MTLFRRLLDSLDHLRSRVERRTGLKEGVVTLPRVPRDTPRPPSPATRSKPPVRPLSHQINVVQQLNSQAKAELSVAKGEVPMEVQLINEIGHFLRLADERADDLMEMLKDKHT